MLLKTKTVAQWVGSAIVCATLTTSGVVAAKAVVRESEQEDPRAAFQSMISKLDKQVSASKKHVFASEGEIKKLVKRVETAGWRVAAARERFDGFQERLSSVKEEGKVTELKNKLSAERKLLKADAEKLSQMVARSKEIRAKSDAIIQELRTLKDDVAIEADRFAPTERGHKRAVKLIADADWVIERLTELNASFESELEEKATEVLAKTEVP